MRVCWAAARHALPLQAGSPALSMSQTMSRHTQGCACPASAALCPVSPFSTTDPPSGMADSGSAAAGPPAVENCGSSRYTPVQARLPGCQQAARKSAMAAMLTAAAAAWAARGRRGHAASHRAAFPTRLALPCSCLLAALSSCCHRFCLCSSCAAFCAYTALLSFHSHLCDTVLLQQIAAFSWPQMLHGMTRNVTIEHTHYSLLYQH